jgi:hypothetical protein
MAFQLREFSMDGNKFKVSERSRGGAEVWIHGDAPLPKQPFRDIAPIPVLPAPVAELTRQDIHLWRESQLPDPEFEFSCVSGERAARDAPNWGCRVCARARHVSP